MLTSGCVEFPCDWTKARIITSSYRVFLCSSPPQSITTQTNATHLTTLTANAYLYVAPRELHIAHIALVYTYKC